MKLSTKGRYGARVMLNLASQAESRPQPLRAIAERTGITVKYLEQIIARLVGAGLVQSSRGQSGGYILAKPAEEIRLSIILQALEGSLAPVACVEDAGQCDRAAECITREIWEELNQTIWQKLESISLSDMVNRLERKRATPQSAMYFI